MVPCYRGSTLHRRREVVRVACSRQYLKRQAVRRGCQDIGRIGVAIPQQISEAWDMLEWKQTSVFWNRIQIS